MFTINDVLAHSVEAVCNQTLRKRKFISLPDTCREGLYVYTHDTKPVFNADSTAKDT